MKLYELTEQFRKLEEMACGIDCQEDSDALSALWAEIADGFEEKAERTAMVIKNLSAESEAIKAEEERLRLRRKAIESSADNLKGYLEAHMKATGINKVQGKLFTLSIQKNPPSLKLDEEKLADGWWRIKREPDSAKIKDAIKDGQDVTGAWLEQGESLRIR